MDDNEEFTFSDFGEFPEYWSEWPKVRVINPDEPENAQEGYLYAEGKEIIGVLLEPPAKGVFAYSLRENCQRI